MTDTDSED